MGIIFNTKLVLELYTGGLKMKDCQFQRTAPSVDAIYFR